MNTLSIDTSSNSEIKVGLKTNEKTDWLVRSIDKQKAQVVLPMIKALLEKHKLKKEQLEEIEVVTGPGSFTGLRVGTAIANALGFTLNISVNGKKQIVVPTY